jgi:hypothetical protein
MKLYILLTIAITLFFSLVNGLAIRYDDMSDFEIARSFISNDAITNSAGAIVYPTNYITWYVGENVNVTFEDEGTMNQTVSIFFFDQTNTLAGGSLEDRKTFHFIVPAAALSPPNNTSLLLAVRRQNRYLQTVDSVIVKVLPAKV